MLAIEGSQIEPPPVLRVRRGTEHDFILGIGKAAERVIFLLDIGRVLSQADARDVAQAAIAA